MVCLKYLTDGLLYVGLYCSLMWLKNGVAAYPLVSGPHKILELFPTNSLICWHQVRKKYGLEKFVHWIPIYNFIVVGSTVTES